jgi:hypothetical protein
MMMGLIGLTKRQTKDASDKMKDEDERRIKSDKILNTSFLLLVFCFCCRARVLPGFTPWGKMSDFDWPK